MNNEFNREIGNRIRILREEKGLTKEQVHDMMKSVSIDMYRQWESGNNDFKAEQIGKLAQCFGCSADYLIFGNETDYSELIKKIKESKVPAGKFLELIKSALNLSNQ